MSDHADLLAELAALRQESRERDEALRRELAEVREKLTQREQVLVGWKDIAAHLGYSEDHCKELGQDPFDPIPHWHQGGMVAAYRTMLDAWLFRRRKPAQRRLVREEETERVSRQLDMFDAPKTPKRGRAKDGSAS
jgi:hypothetical protein